MPPASTARRHPARPRRPPFATAALALTLGACASAGGTAPLPPPDAGTCRPTGERAARAGTLVVAAEGDVDPLRAPLPSSAAERLLFRHLYGTLVRVDCRGRVRQGLAERWSSSGDGTRWTLRLDPDARFADGTPVTAGDVVTAWHGTDLASDGGHASPLDGIAVSAPSERTLVVTAEDPIAGPAAFAEPRFAVTGGSGRSSWPLASGAFRPAPVDGGPLPGRVVGLVPRGAAADGPRLRLVAAGEGRSRDVLDAGADVLLTREPAAARYAGDLPGYRVHPLPWDRAWVLALPPDGSAGSGDGPEDGGWEEVRRGLAGEAIPAEARPARGPGLPWSACPAVAAGRAASTDHAGDDDAPAGSGGSVPVAAPPSIVYPAHEPAGRALAARLAALAGGAGPGGQTVARALGRDGSSARTRGLGAGAYERSLDRGSAAAYLLALPLRPLVPCRLRTTVLRRTPWLGGGRLVPLVETRPLLVLRRGVAGVELDWDGTPRLEAAGWAAGVAEAPPDGRDPVPGARP